MMCDGVNNNAGKNHKRTIKTCLLLISEKPTKLIFVSDLEKKTRLLLFLFHLHNLYTVFLSCYLAKIPMSLINLSIIHLIN